MEMTLAEVRRAQTAWAAWPLGRRLEVIRRARQALVDQGVTLADLAGADRPRTVAETVMAEVVPVADACRFLEREARRILKPRRVGASGRPAWLWGVRSEVRREPWGVVLIIAPSNYHLFLAGVQAIQALVAGNAVLWKPAHGGRGVAVAFARLLTDSQLPEGLLTVLAEEPRAAAEAIEQGVDKVVLTGSAATGRSVLSGLAAGLVPATMELSGCDAVLVLGDADLDLVADALTFSLRFNASETCIAARRVFVPRARAEDFERRLAARLTAIPPRPLDSRSGEVLGPSIREALDHESVLLSGEAGPDGTLVGPLVLTKVRPGLRLLREAPFAPVLSIVHVADEEEAFRLADEGPFGLGASIFGEPLRAQALAGRIRAGGVVVNDLIAPTADPRLPFGGRGQSGFGVTRGAEGLLEMTTPKVVSLAAAGPRLHYVPLDQDDDLGTAVAYLKAAHGRTLGERVAALPRLAGGLARWARRRRRAQE
jgi:acyl-CoA reductase-like NAD-dependent aldehyde dehydrogenase